MKTEDRETLYVGDIVALKKDVQEGREENHVEAYDILGRVLGFARIQNNETWDKWAEDFKLVLVQNEKTLEVKMYKEYDLAAVKRGD